MFRLLFVLTPLFALCFLVSCAGTNKSSAYLYSTTELSKMVKKRTMTVKSYNKLDTVMIADVIRLDSALLKKAKETGSLSGVKDENENSRKFILALYTADDAWNDLHDNNPHITIDLKTSDGNKTLPSLINRLRDEKIPFTGELPFAPTFRKFYYVAFDRQGQSACPCEISFNSPLGSVSVKW